MISTDLTGKKIGFSTSFNEQYPAWMDKEQGKEHPKVNLLWELVNNGWAEVRDYEVCLGPEEYYAWLESNTDFEDEKLFNNKILGLPPYYRQIIYISGKGLIYEDTFSFMYNFYKKCTSFGPDEPFAYKRDGAFLFDQAGNAVAMLDALAYRMLEMIDNPEDMNNWMILAELQKHSDKKHIVLDDTLGSHHVVLPKKINLNINMDNDVLELFPEIESDALREEEGDSFNKRYKEVFDRRTGVDSVASIQEDDNSRIRIPFSDKQRNELVKIKQNNRIVAKKTQLDIQKNPEKYFDPDIINLDVLYSDRVIEIGLYKPRVYPFISLYKSEWLPGYVIEDGINGNVQVLIDSMEKVKTLDQAVRKAETQGSSTVQYKGEEIPIAEARRVRDVAEKYFGKTEKEIKPEKSLIIKENLDVLEYSKEISMTQFEHSFEELPDFSDSITLRQHQIEGVAWLQQLYQNRSSGALLADEMGLGKTLQVLYFCEWLAKKEDGSKILVTAPVALIENWKNEYQRFFGKQGKYKVLTLNELDINIDRYVEQHKDKHILFISNYEHVRRKQFQFAAVDWNVVIADEAQKIKTPGRLVTNAMKALKATFKIAITGTPVENSFHDLWCIMDFAVPGLLGSAKSFKKNYGIGKDITSSDMEAVGNRIREDIGVFIKLRKKSDVLQDLPHKYDSDTDSDRFHKLNLLVEMPRIQREAYYHVLKQREEDVQIAIKGKDKNPALKKIMALKSISDYPYLGSIDYDAANTGKLIKESARIMASMDILDMIRKKNEKVVVFAEFKKTQRLLSMIFENRYNIHVDIVNGDTPALGNENRNKFSRQQLIDQFNSRNGFAIIIMSPIAAGVGLNVTGANHVIHFSRHWNPAKEAQATDRVHRIGQEKDVFVYYPKAVLKEIESFDIVLGKLLMQKKKLSDSSLFPTEAAEVRSADLLAQLQ